MKRFNLLDSPRSSCDDCTFGVNFEFREIREDPAFPDAALHPAHRCNLDVERQRNLWNGNLEPGTSRLHVERARLQRITVSAMVIARMLNFLVKERLIGLLGNFLGIWFALCDDGDGTGLLE